MPRPSDTSDHGLARDAPPGERSRLVRVTRKLVLILTLAWLVAATWVALGGAPPILSENLWAAAVVPFQYPAFYDVVAAPWVITVAGWLFAAMVVLLLGLLARQVIRFGPRVAARAVLRWLRDGVDVAILLALVPPALGIGGLVFACCSKPLLVTLVAAWLIATVLSVGFDRLAARKLPRPIVRLALRCTLVWISASGFGALLAASGVVAPGPKSRYALLVLAWLATRQRTSDDAASQTAYTVLATAAMVPILFLHAGVFADLNIGPRAPVACEEVARQRLVTRVFDLGRRFGETKFYEVLVIPSHGLAAMTLFEEPHLALVDLESGKTELIPLTLDGDTVAPDGAERQGVVFDAERERLLVTSYCGLKRAPTCPDIWDVDLATHAAQPRFVSGLERPTLITLLPTQRELVVTRDFRDVLTVVNLDTFTARFLHRPGVDFWRQAYEPRSERVLLSRSHRGRELWAFDPRADSLEPVADVGPVSSGIAVDALRGRVYLGRPLLSRIDVLDSTTFERVASLPAPFGVRGLALDPSSETLLAGSFFTAEAYVIDLRTTAFVRVATGGPVRGVAVDPTRARGYFASPCGLLEVSLARTS